MTDINDTVKIGAQNLPTTGHCGFWRKSFRLYSSSLQMCSISEYDNLELAPIPKLRERARRIDFKKVGLIVRAYTLSWSTSKSSFGGSIPNTSGTFATCNSGMMSVSISMSLCCRQGHACPSLSPCYPYILVKHGLKQKHHQEGVKVEIWMEKRWGWLIMPCSLSGPCM